MAKSGNIIIEQLTVGTCRFWVAGDTPMLMHSMSAKAKRELLFPRGKMTTAQKAQQLKHDPRREYVDSTIRSKDDSAPTRLLMPSTAFKSAICDAALEVPGAKKTQIGRLVWVLGEHVHVYGVPQLHISVVRNSGFNAAPDIRTRAILPTWAVEVPVRFVAPTLDEVGISRLLETAGLVIGVGDFRQAKGKGSYGQFHVCDAGEVSDIVASGGRDAQDAALKDPTPYDDDSAELLAWYESEILKRGGTKKMAE